MELKFKTSQVNEYKIEISTLKSCLKTVSSDTVKEIQQILHGFKAL